MELVFKKEKETKNTVRFQEEPAEAQGPIIDTLYVQKWFVRDADTLKVTIDRE